MSGWSTHIRFGLVANAPAALVPPIHRMCAHFTTQYICPLGWFSEATSRQRKESEGFVPLLEQRQSLHNIRSERRIAKKVTDLLADPRFGGVMISYTWDRYGSFFSDESCMQPPSFHWYLCPEGTDTVLLLNVEHAMGHLSQTHQWQVWLEGFLTQTTQRLSAGRWEARRDDADDLTYDALA